jgi:hypothetical protein
MLDKIVEIVDRLSTDLGFRELCETQPEVALASYNLSAEERVALQAAIKRDDVLPQNPGRLWH